jgi:hypothetical protein
MAFLHMLLLPLLPVLTVASPTNVPNPGIPQLWKRSDPPTQVAGHNGWSPVQGGCWGYVQMFPRQNSQLTVHITVTILTIFVDSITSSAALIHSQSSTASICVKRRDSSSEPSSLVMSAVSPVLIHRHAYSLTPSLPACGNTIIGTNRPSSAEKCNLPCAGNAQEQCGGQANMNLYVRDSFQFKTGPASLLPSYNNFDQKGCWQYVFLYGVPKLPTFLHCVIETARLTASSRTVPTRRFQATS